MVASSQISPLSKCKDIALYQYCKRLLYFFTPDYLPHPATSLSLCLTYFIARCLWVIILPNPFLAQCGSGPSRSGASSFPSVALSATDPLLEGRDISAFPAGQICPTVISGAIKKVLRRSPSLQRCHWRGNTRSFSTGIIIRRLFMSSNMPLPPGLPE